MSALPTAPLLELEHLDHLWFQVGGTLCNLTCRHCFISCSPHNRSFGFLGLEQVREALEESVVLGVKEYYFTGGEPFLNPEMTDILEATLRYGPATVLTNATVLKDEWLGRLRAAAEASPYSLEFRVSIDGPSAAINDPVRGAGTFRRAMRGLEELVRFGFLPIVTMTRTWEIADDERLVRALLRVLRDLGYERPRLKILPLLRIGAEEHRTHGYGPGERVTEEMLAGYDVTQLVCHHSRIVTDRGVYVCPILIDSPDARLGTTLREALGPYRLAHGACTTCHAYGAICSNPTGANA